MLSFFGWGNDSDPSNNSAVAHTDKELMAIQDAIATRKQMLLDKQQYIAQIQSQNEFLKVVKADYDNYNKQRIDEQQRQIKAMEMLTNYLDSLKQQGALSAENLTDALTEQEKIKAELNALRQKLGNTESHFT